VRVDVKEIKEYLEHSGLKQKVVAEKSGIGEAQFCMALQGKRKFEAGEYAGICNVLGVPMTKFIKPRLPDIKEVG
jgi:transcriptional regulator with XRE-family HTH domain